MPRLGRNRKTEPTLIFKCRVFMMIVILGLFLGYAIILTLEVVSDKNNPVVNTKYKDEASLPFPWVVLISMYKLSIDCNFLYDGKSIILIIDYVSYRR